MSINVMDSLLDAYKTVQADKRIGIFGNPIRHTIFRILFSGL